MEGGIRIELSPDSLRKVLSMAKEASPAVKRHVTRNLKDAAGPAAEAARSKVRDTLPPRAQFGKRGKPRPSRHTGLRENIARGVRVGVGTGKASAGVKIVSSARFLPPNQARMNRTYNQETFHHPVFGRGSVPQHGVRWFYEPIEARKDDFREAVLRALQAAVDELDRL